ncbi:Non-hem dioxygenase N-terminal domain [Dillenia turbinata]|uniref:Non-hem dioxygenase N-terminal domain n=1 Tax=Dillenia turbinata TaxID=194707 RepID=A0AAN8VPB6_9MAGN
MTEKLVSSWFNVESLPEDYIFPEETRPGKFAVVSHRKTVPVIDLKKVSYQDRSDLVQQIIKASEEFGFFQVINHGVSMDLVDDTMNVMKEFFNLPAEEKASVYSVDPKQCCRLYTSSVNFDREKVHFWRDHLRHPCTPLEECMKSWPQKPTRYREVVREYSVELKKLGLRIMELICEGIGLDPRYCENELSKLVLLSVNHYPPCPDPSLALGLPKHADPNLITVLHQGDVYGLQVFKDGEWISVEPLPNALVINIGYQLKIISNGRLNSAEHRAVTNSIEARTSIALFISPSFDCIVEPAMGLVNESNPPLFRAFVFKEFLSHYTSNYGEAEAILKHFKLQA